MVDARQSKAILFALAAAVFYAVSTPASKILLQTIPATMLAGLLYLGAGAGMVVVFVARRIAAQKRDERVSEKPLSRAELPYTIGMVVLDIAAPILLMVGLSMASAANVSLLNNFEIVATALVAALLFKERIGRRLWVAIILVTLASALLTIGDVCDLSLSWGSLCVLLACVCWGFENNCTRRLSVCDPVQIVVVKGIGSGFGSLILALALGERCANAKVIALALLLGFIAYGLSILLYVYAQRYLGAAKTSAYYAIAPFVGAVFSLVIFKEQPSQTFLLALAIMLVGAWLASVPARSKHV